MIPELIESAKLAGLFMLIPIVMAVLAAVGDRLGERRFRRNLVPVETHHDFDDWFEPVEPFYRSKFESHTRSRLAVAVTCGADPENNEGQAAATAGPHATHGGVGAHESFRGQ